MISQILGMVRYEILMSWRRGALRLIAVAMLILPAASIFIVAREDVACMCDQYGQPVSAEIAVLLQTSVVLGISIVVTPVLMLIVPLMMADTIPLDRHYRVNELLNTLPIEPHTYLLGKVGAVLCGVFALLTVASIPTAVFVAFQHYTLDPYPILIFWLGGLLVLALTGVSLGVLLPAVATSRGRAIMFGFIAAIANVVIYPKLPMNAVLQASTLQVSSAMFPSEVLIPDYLREYPNLLSLNYLQLYGVLVLMITLLFGLLVWRMRAAETPI